MRASDTKNIIIIYTITNYDDYYIMYINKDD